MKKISDLIQSNSRYLFNLCSTFLSQIVSALSILILTPVLLHRLGQSDFGIYGVILNVVVFSGIFDFGLNIGLLKKLIYKVEESVTLINTIFFFFIGLLLIGIPTLYWLFDIRVLKAGDHILFYSVITCLLIIQNILATLFDVILQSANKIFVGKVIRVIKLVLDFVCILLLSNFHSVSLLLIASAIVNMVYILLLVIYARKEIRFPFAPTQFSFPLLASHVGYSFWYSLNAVAAMLVFNSQVILMNMFIGAEGVARYLIITRFYEIIRIGVANFTIILFPTLASIQAEGNWTLIKDMFFKSLARVSAFALLIFVITIFIAKPFFLKWSKFPDHEMAVLFTVFAVFIMFIVVDNVSATFISALKLNKVPTIVSIVQGILGLTLGYFLLMKYGIIGMAIASLFALICTNFIFNPLYLLKKINQQIQGASNTSNSLDSSGSFNSSNSLNSSN